jgi:hypothetical protein
MREESKMAKITANGATEVARITTRFTHTNAAPGYEESRYLWVINSKGTVLRRLTGEYGSGYVVRARKLPPSRDTLLALAEKAGHQVVK